MDFVRNSCLILRVLTSVQNSVYIFFELPILRQFFEGGEKVNKLKRFIIGAAAGAVLFGSIVTPVLAGSLLRGQEQTIPSDGSGNLEKVCQSTTVHGDAVTHADAGGLSTSTSEDCSI